MILLRNMYIACKRGLCIPVSNVPSKSVFSKAMIIVNAFHSRLKLQRVNNVVFLPQNME